MFCLINKNQVAFNYFLLICLPQSLIAIQYSVIEPARAFERATNDNSASR